MIPGLKLSGLIVFFGTLTACAGPTNDLNNQTSTVQEAKPAASEIPAAQPRPATGTCLKKSCDARPADMSDADHDSPLNADEEKQYEAAPWGTTVCWGTPQPEKGILTTQHWCADGDRAFEEVPAARLNSPNLVRAKLKTVQSDIPDHLTASETALYDQLPASQKVCWTAPEGPGGTGTAGQSPCGPNQTADDVVDPGQIYDVKGLRNRQLGNR